MINQDIYNDAGVYNVGGGGGGSINGFEILDKLFLESRFYYGNAEGTFTNKLNIATITNDCEIIAKFWLKADDHLGGNENYIFGLRNSAYGQTSPGYFSSMTIGAIVQNNYINVRNGGAASYQFDRGARIGGLNELHFVNRKVYFNGNEIPVPFVSATVNTIFYFPMMSNGNPVDTATGERAGESMAMVSLEIYDTNGVKIVDCRPAKRLYDGKIGAFDLCRCVFWDNGNFYDTP